MSDSDDPVVIPESPPTRLARTPRARARTTAPRQASSDEDDIVALDAPPITPAQTAPRAARPKSRKKRVSGDDEIVFLRESPRTSLAKRYTYAGAPASRRVGKSGVGARSAPVGSVRSTTNTAGPSVFGAPVASVTSALLPPRDDPAPPVPEWLGRSSVLLKLRDCPVCRRAFKKADAGPARWRHVATCLPLAYRPPNPGPDIKALVVAALHPQRELTLLGQRTHAASLAETLESAVELDLPSRPKLNLTTVTALTGREGEVDDRLRSFLGSPEPEAAGWTGDAPSLTPPGPLWSPSPSPPRSRSPTESLSGSEPELAVAEEEEDFPATQEMGTSSLASEYARPPRSPRESETLLLQAPPALGLTQQVREDFARREATQRRRDAIAASQWEDPGEENDGGWFTPSQQQGSPSRTPATTLDRWKEDSASPAQRVGLSPVQRPHGPSGAGAASENNGAELSRGAGGATGGKGEGVGKGLGEGRRVWRRTVTPTRPLFSSPPDSPEDTTPTKRAKNNAGHASPARQTPPSSAMKSMRISSPVVISSSEEEPTPRRAGQWDEWGAGADLVFVPSDNESAPSSAEEAIPVSSGEPPLTVSSGEPPLTISSGEIAMVSSGEEAISVPSSDGLEDDDEDVWASWGADAVMHFEAFDDASSASSPARSPSPSPAARPVANSSRTPRSSTSRTPQASTSSRDPRATSSRPEMPDYASWTLPRLKKLVEGYGFRAGKDKGGLVRVATECWVAIHGAPSESEEDVPLAQVITPRAKSSTRRGAASSTVTPSAAATSRRGAASSSTATPSATTSDPKGKGKSKQKESDTETETSLEALDDLFFHMIRDDDAFYLRILRYEPIHWDEFISRAIRAGADAKGWKDRLRHFLDHQGITFYTAEPGQNRSRQRKRR